MFDNLFRQEHMHTTDSPELIQQNISDGKAVMLDVRSQEEFDAGHLAGVIFIPFDAIQNLDPNATQIPNLDKSKIIYCH